MGVSSRSSRLRSVSARALSLTRVFPLLFPARSVTPTTRRLWLYGLLLVLPALAVGGLALGLLMREQARLAEREQAARESRRAAVETRARLVAENIELLLGDVQLALMTTLFEAPTPEPRPFLTEWQATNPLVRGVFLATADGRPVWDTGGPTVQTWLAEGAPWAEGRGAAAPLDAMKPTAASSDPDAGEIPGVSRESNIRLEAQAVGAGNEARRDISDNVLQYTRARREIQEVAKVRTFGDIAAQSAPSSAPSPAAPNVLEATPTSASTAFWVASAPVFEDARDEAAEARSAPPRRGLSDASAADPLTRSGWTPWRDGGGLHLFGWRELPDRTVVGLELRLDAIKARLGEVFPAAPASGEAYVLRDTDGTTWFRAGAENVPTTIEVSLAAAALPGWIVAGEFASGPGSSGAGFGFLAAGAAMIGLLVLAILAAGALLVQQARASEGEATVKTSFVANVSHELKTPLTTIRLYAELLAQDRVRDEAKRADYLATIGREAERLTRLVGDVLDFSRLEEGKKRYEIAPLDLAAELRRLAATHGPRLAEAGLELRAALPATHMLTTDRDAVEQIVLNLLDNACKYAAQGGEVSLVLAPLVGGGVELRVADRGPGVPARQRERVFEKFHRVDERLSAEKSGAGLGLSIARQLARGLRGDLRYAARAGGGAEFVLTLP